MRAIPSGKAFLLLAFLTLLGGAEALAQQVGSIEGEVDLKIRRPRRSASRYSGGSSSAHVIQRIAPVAFIRGPVPGVPQTSSMLTMEQSDTSFVPSLLVVGVGSTVLFPNGDPFFHNVFSYSSAKRFDLGRYPRGGVQAGHLRRGRYR